MTNPTSISTSLSPARQRSWLYWALSDTLVVARRHLLHIPHVPEQLMSATIQPIMFVLLFRYVFGGAIQTPESSYVNYLMAGIFVQSVVMEGLTAGVGIAYDLKQGIIDRFRTLPMVPAAVLIGPIVADLARNMFIVGVMVSVGLAVGFRPVADATSWLAAIGLLSTACFAVSWIGAMVALIARDPQAVQTMVFVVFMPLTFCSSAFVPVETMPEWLQPVAMNQPVSIIVNSVRSLLLGGAVGSAPWMALVWCAAIVAVCMPVSVVFYRRMTRN